MNTETSKTHTDSAHLLRAIERGIAYDRLPAPIAIDIQAKWGAVMLRFATGEDVREWVPLTGATVVVGRLTIFDRDTTSPWHEVGTRQGGKDGELVGWQVSMWASVDGLPPAEPEHVVAFAKYDADGEFTLTPIQPPAADELAAAVDKAFLPTRDEQQGR